MNKDDKEFVAMPIDCTVAAF